MAQPIVHIYGPFAIQWYGLTIALGLLAFVVLIRKHPRFKNLGVGDMFASVLLAGIIAGLLGGRLLYLVGDANGVERVSDLFNFWQGGFSVLGSILGVLAVVPLYLRYIGVSVLPFFDIAALHAPLLQSISRIGCFITGCCYGKPMQYWWGVTYTEPSVAAPLHVRLHPTQLYSAGILFIIFLVMYFFVQKKCTKPGQLLTIYLMLSSAERFFVDIWRADQTVQHVFWVLSLQQLIALGIFAASTSAYIGITLLQQRCRTP